MRANVGTSQACKFEGSMAGGGPEDDLAKAARKPYGGTKAVSATRVKRLRLGDGPEVGIGLDRVGWVTERGGRLGERIAWRYSEGKGDGQYREASPDWLATKRKRRGGSGEREPGDGDDCGGR